jgi:malonyl CoA-acyl carrier protein transacylase
MIGDGIRSFVEVGPGDMLSKMSRWIDRTTTCRLAGSLASIRAAADSLRRS